MSFLAERFWEELDDYRADPHRDGQGFAYALVDTNQEANLNVMLDGMARSMRPLSRTAQDGPVLVRIERGEGVADWLLGAQRGKRLAIFLFSTHDFDEVWSHVRRFTKVVTPQGEEASFRFYDPHVFNRYISVLSAEQRQVVYARLDRIYGEFGPYLMRSDLEAGEATVRWTLFSDAPGAPVEKGTSGVPQIDMTGSRHAPLFHLSKAQYEYPVIFNMPALIEDVDAYLREDFEKRMNCYAPGLLRAMIEASMRTALERFELRDLVILRQFAELQWRIAPGFHKQRDIRALLSDLSQPPAQRWGQLLSPAFEDALVDAFDFNRTEDWDLTL